jgi:hypothetical protein
MGVTREDIMSNEIAKFLDVLEQKLGPLAKDALAAYTQRAYACALVETIGGAVLLIVGIVASLLCFHEGRKPENQDGMWLPPAIIVLVVAVVIGGLLLGSGITHLMSVRANAIDALLANLKAMR